MKRQILYGLVLVTVFSIAFAEETTKTTAPIDRDKTTIMAGVGVLVIDKPHKGGDTDILPIPLFLYQKDRLVLTGTKISYYLIYDEDWAVSLIGAPRFEGYDDDESTTLNGMADREATYEAGLECSRKLDWGTFSAKFFADVLGEHNGQEIQLTYKKNFDDILNIKSLNLTPLIGINWRSKQLNDYYYGVEGSEATATRPEYHAGSSTGILAGLRVDYPVTERWNLFGSLNIEWLSSEMTDSPIVNEDTMVSFLLGAMYKF